MGFPALLFLDAMCSTVAESLRAIRVSQDSVGRRLGRVLLGQPQQRPVPGAERTPHRPLPSGWVSGGRLAQAAEVVVLGPLFRACEHP